MQSDEESNRKGKTRDLFKEIKEITGSFTAKCSAIKSSTGPSITESAKVKERWKEYTENLYKRDPRMTDVFTETDYDDEPLILEGEVKKALNSISNQKSPGIDSIPIELVKAGNDAMIKVITSLCNKVWTSKIWPKDWKKSIYIPIFKKGDKKECSNYRTIALISHTSKILLRIIQNRLEPFIMPNLPDEQAGFRKGRGTRDHIANMRTIMEKMREFKKRLYLCFIDYSKAFDCVDHHRLWIILQQIGVPTHLIVILRNLYEDQKATIRTEFGETEEISIGKGVRQGCILSPVLFNIYAEIIMRKVIEEYGEENGIHIGGRRLTNLRYADDTTLLEKSEEKMKELLQQVQLASEEAGLYLNINKTKIMSTDRLTTFNLNGEDIEVVKNFQFLGVMMSEDNNCGKEIKRRIAIGRAAMMNMRKIWVDDNIRINTKTRLVKALIFPIVTYGAESWVMNRADRKKIDSFELWCWRRMLQISWKDRVTNEQVIQQIRPGETLESVIIRMFIRYGGHVLRRDGSMEKDLMTGMVEGQRGRGRPRKRYWDMMKELVGMNSDRILRATRDRRAWRNVVMNVTRGRPRLDGTR